MLCGIFFGRRKRLRMLAVLGLGVVISMGTLLTGCDGGGPPAVGATHFTVTVTATPASGSNVSPQTTTVGVTVN